MDYVGVKLLIALAIISALVGIDAKPQLEPGKQHESGITKVCNGGPHDKLKQCGSSCPATCSTPDPQICTMQCIINVCQCDEDYVRGPNGQCIHRDECPK